jgi:uncharacterized alkaline shock family protein YloU
MQLHRLRANQRFNPTELSAWRQRIWVENLRQIIKKDAKYGVELLYDHDGLVIDLYIVVEYGLLRIKTITSSIANQC